MIKLLRLPSCAPEALANALVAGHRSSWFRNNYHSGTPPAPERLAAVAPRCDHIHLKDRSAASGRTVPLGQGDIDFAALLPVLLGASRAHEVLASIETHVPGDRRNATRHSLFALRHLAEHIGVEVG